MLTLTNLHKSFAKELPVLDSVNWSFTPGETTGIFGLNGSGKTTLLRLLAHTYLPGRGKITYHGEKLDKIKNYTSRVAFINSETRNLYRRLTGAQNLAFFKTLFKLETADSQIKEWLEELGILGAMSKQISTYSMGMKQKLWVVIQLLRDSEILLLDEFTDHLDQQSINFFKNKIYQHQNFQQKTVVYASRRIDFTKEFAGRVLTLKDGQLV
ncbi:MAG: ABC transporter ATP-binding protein [Bacteriovoracaceae bacterium]|nr:ABC transporter ATP-binding protein [Bacteriovoracaceae bacterium]